MTTLLVTAILTQVSGEALDRLVAELDAKAVKLEAGLEAKEKRAVRVGVVVSRMHAQDLRSFRVATYRFEHATRVGTGRDKRDFDYGNGHGGDRIAVRIHRDDEDLIWDLGETDFDVPALPAEPMSGAKPATAAQGHVYVIQTILQDADQWAKMQVLEHSAGQWMLFRWELIADATRYAPLELASRTFLKSGAVRLQVRGGAGGGNPNQVFMVGAPGMYVDRMSDTPLDMASDPTMNERHVGYTGGGYIPRGKVWIVFRIEYEGTAKGDTNGPGEFVVAADRRRLVWFSSRAEPIKDVWKGRLVVRRWQERGVYVEVANSSKADVVLKGVLLDAKWADVEKFPPLTEDESKRAEAFLADLAAEDIGKRETARRGLIDLGPPAIEWLKSKPRTGEIAAILRELEVE